MRHQRFSTFVTVLAVLLGGRCLHGQDSAFESTAQAPSDAGQQSADNSQFDDIGINAPANYHLAIGDSILIKVQGESDCSIRQTIDLNGEVRPVYIDRVNILDLTVREAEELIQRRYIEERYFRAPVVRISLAGYSKKVVFLQGNFARNGPFTLPSGRESMKISELITFAGGLTDYAKNKVKVTRANGEVIQVNIQSILRREKNAPEDIPIYPGDMLWVGEKWL